MQNIPQPGQFFRLKGKRKWRKIVAVHEIPKHDDIPPIGRKIVIMDDQCRQLAVLVNDIGQCIEIQAEHPPKRLIFLVLTSEGYPQESFDDLELLNEYMLAMEGKSIAPWKIRNLTDGIPIVHYVKGVDTFQIRPMKLNSPSPFVKKSEK